MQIRRWHAHSSLEALQEDAAAKVLQSAEISIRERGTFRLVLAGGNTPKALYEKLAHADAAWSSWEIYFGDERCLPPSHAERNSRMAFESWLSHVPIPENRIHVIPAELGPKEGAARYSETLKDIGEFDLVLLGLGEDGHTASLFPGKTWENQDAFAVFDSPKPPPERISLSASRLSLSRQVFFLVSGESKKQAVADWRSEKSIPASIIAPPAGVDIFIESHLLG
ncbi:MAG: 6-phosphogluconolactonase [Burkholderiales bacterium]